MYWSSKITNALNNKLDTNSKRQFLRCICAAHEECYLCQIKEECDEACEQTPPNQCSDYQIHKLFEKVI